MPLLVEHFIVHKKIDPSMSFWQFLEMHYAHGDVRDADYEEDMKLPFKTIEINFNFTFVLIPPDLFSMHEAGPSVVERMINNASRHWKSNLLLACIWQPPR